ncbi:hypothetical protein [Neobacillus niacini]|uniref:hypothetical protein n=1 Tax=Neobacillus niacini TaxID=86668 RepID=UPI002FFE9EF0
MNWLTGLRSVSVLTLHNHFHSLWCSNDFVMHGWLTGAFLKEGEVPFFVEVITLTMQFS